MIQKEKYNQIIEEVYENYEKNTNDFQLENPIDDFIIKTLRGEMIKIETEDGDDYRILTQEEFVNKCKTDKEFSEKWGLTIKEIELSLGERYDIHPKYITEDKLELLFELATDENLDKLGVPTKLNTVTYNNETIKIYE
jgi:hypothetical protein